MRSVTWTKNNLLNLTNILKFTTKKVKKKKKKERKKKCSDLFYTLTCFNALKKLVGFIIRKC